MTPLSMLTVFLLLSPVALGGDLFSNGFFPTADDVADSILDKIFDKVVSWIEDIENWILEKLTWIQTGIDDFIGKYINPKLTGDEGIIRSSYSLIISFLFILLWFGFIKLVIAGLDVWVYVLDIIPFV